MNKNICSLKILQKYGQFWVYQAAFRPKNFIHPFAHPLREAYAR